jgi:60 kDa SS-A/Ro ribonucleoprotein
MKFNTAKQKASAPDTLNLAGGKAHAQSSKMELVSILLTSMLEKQFYRDADQTAVRLRELVCASEDKTFVAKAALYARNEAGMRSVTHLVAGELAKAVKGAPWTARFFDKIIRRPDDALEVLAYYMGKFGKPVPNALKKGLGAALARFDEYQVAKYRRSDAAISLVDVVNLVHPPHTEALSKLVKGTLKAAETWETKLTQAGQAAESEEEAGDLKREAWENLVRDRKIGYFALLRNLRNILQIAPDVEADAIAMLKDEKLIRKSLVLPFRYLTALEALQGANLANAGRVMAALSDAVDKSLANVPRFEGKTLIALDDSGSMMGKPIKIGALFTAVLAKSNDTDVLLFSDTARYVSLNTGDSTLTLAQWIEGQAIASGTNFHCIFQEAKRAYDRVVILSDMQGWMGHHTPAGPFAAYKQRMKADPKVFSFDLQGYGTLQFPERNVFCLAGFSDKTMDTLTFLDSDKQALLKQIEAVEL